MTDQQSGREAPDRNLQRLPSSSLHIKVIGRNSSDAPTILFVHGLGGSSNNFIPLIKYLKLEDSHHIVLFDLEGHGLSPLTGKPIELDTYVQSLKEVLEHVQLNRAVVIGHSMGGFIVTTFAALYPHLVSKLVLIGPVKQMPEAAQSALTSRASDVRENGMAGIANTVATNGVSPTADPLAFGYVYASLMSTPAEGYARACLALANARDPDYDRITNPVLIIAGTQDKTSPAATVDYLQESIKVAQVVRLVNVGHWQPVEAVPKVAEAIQAFL